jgi:hypothetical protein
MLKLTAADLLPLEDYARARAAIRSRLILYRAGRQLAIGPHCTLSFEDRETVRYQVQEMLRAEKVFESAGIDEELAAYNPLIPDGENFKATMLLEFPEPVERVRWLAQLRGIERRCWLRVGSAEALYAIADEDMERENAEKTSAVHFLRYELGADGARALRGGAGLALGIDHPQYRYGVDPVPEPLRQALLADLA